MLEDLLPQGILLEKWRMALLWPVFVTGEAGEVPRYTWGGDWSEPRASEPRSSPFMTLCAGGSGGGS